MLKETISKRSAARRLGSDRLYACVRAVGQMLLDEGVDSSHLLQLTLERLEARTEVQSSNGAYSR